MLDRKGIALVLINCCPYSCVSYPTATVSTLETYLQCKGYKDYRLVYSPQDGFTCMSPCSAGYCEHGGQCQHLPDGPHCR